MDVRVKDLWDRVTGFPPDGRFPAVAFRDEVLELHATALDEKNRVCLLRIFNLVCDMAVNHLERSGEDLTAFTQRRISQYYTFLRTEAYVDGELSMARLRAVTAREILAGRMVRDDPLRRVAEDPRRFLDDFKW